jgi:hypothetical protein
MLSTIPLSIAPEYLTQTARSDIQKELKGRQYVRLPKFFDPEYFAHVRDSAFALEGEKIERKFIMPGCNTPRYMHTIGGSVIRRFSPFLTSLYESERLRSFLTDVTGDAMYECTHPNEFMVLHFLENVGATHGWHLDDPPFALVIVLEAPPAIAGGLLEFIPRWREYCDAANISENDDVAPLVEKLRALEVIQRRHHAAGDAFLIKADEVLHRVTPFKWLIQRRAIMNLAYQNTADASYGVSASLLYDQEPHHDLIDLNHKEPQ